MSGTHRALKEDTDPRIELDRLQIEIQAKQIAALTDEVGKIFALLRRVAKRLGLPESEPETGAPVAPP